MKKEVINLKISVKTVVELLKLHVASLELVKDKTSNLYKKIWEATDEFYNETNKHLTDKEIIELMV